VHDHGILSARLPVRPFAGLNLSGGGVRVSRAVMPGFVRSW